MHTDSSRRHSPAAHKSAGDGPCTESQQRAVQRHTSSQKALQMLARAAMARAAMALKAILCSAPRAPLPKLLLVAEMPRRMVPAGDSNAFDASMRMTRACIEAAAE